MNQRVDHPQSADDMLQPARLLCLADALEAAGEALHALARRQHGRAARYAFVLRAVRCRVAAELLRRIAE